MQVSHVSSPRAFIGINSVPKKTPKIIIVDFRGLARPVRLVPVKATEKMDAVDARQAVDIERLISSVKELKDKVEHLEGELANGEKRDRDRMIALRGIIKDSLARGGDATAAIDADGVINKLEAASKSIDEGEEDWEQYRNSFTVLMSKGYVQTVDQLRDRLMATEWELGVRPMALILGVAKFEAMCASQGLPISYDTITALYEDPCNLDVIEDPIVRMKARACLVEVETQQRVQCFQMCTAEGQKLAQQFSEGEFISKLLPDPIEHGIVDSMRKVLTTANTMGKFMGR